MAIEYRKFYLTRGQQPPVPGSTGISMPDGGIVWEGKEGTFPTTATIDPKEIGASFTYENHVMSQGELDEYNLLLKYIATIKDGYRELISFDDFKDASIFDAKKAEIKTTINNLSRE